MVKNGPGSRRERSRTRTPSRELTSSAHALREREELLELHRQHRVARDAELALEVELHAGVRIGEHLLEVVVRDVDRALRLAGVALDAGRRVSGQVDGPLAATIA